jgi:agmatine deiminase
MLPKRRKFLQQASVVNFGMLAGLHGFLPLLASEHGDHIDRQYRMPDESAEHQRTWMAFIASEDIWAKRQVAEVQRNLALIASTIARYEPVSMLVRPEDREIAQRLLIAHEAQQFPITLIDSSLNDLWIRDTGPCFVQDSSGKKYAVDFNFNGWGEKQAYSKDAEVAAFIAEQSQVPLISSLLTLEGGCFELDGEGTAIMTESCIINDNRNPGLSKAVIEQELKSLLGLEKIIWLKGIKDKDITDGHTDFYARFVRPGMVVVSQDTDVDSYDYQITRDNIEVLSQATDAQGSSFELVILETPWDITSKYGIKDFAAGYVGYYLCNGAVIMQKFGDVATDSAARKQLQLAFPDRVIEQIAVDGIASGGGSIHCATQQEPKV